MTPPSARELVLLCVEDHPASVEVLRSVLELRPEWRMAHAGDVRAALDLLGVERPNLVLLDVHLPDGTGADILRSMKQGSRTASIPVVVLTAGTTEALARQMLDAGATLYWTKPLDLQALLDLLDDTAEQTRGGDAARL